jgi:hypothetical protein
MKLNRFSLIILEMRVQLRRIKAIIIPTLQLMQLSNQCIQKEEGKESKIR